MDINKVFTITTLTFIILFIIGFLSGGRYINGVIIGAALIIVSWWFAVKGQAASGTIIASLILIFLHILGAVLNLYPQSFAGTTYDTYMHLLAAFVITLLAVDYFNTTKYRKHSFILAAALVFLLGIGVEIVELLKELLFNTLDTSCWNTLCFYWKDTVKDVFNDALGITLALLAKYRK